MNLHTASRSGTGSLGKVLAVIALGAACLSLGGCLKRTINVTTEPPGALVWINDVELGRTPVQTDFNFYGKYDVRIRREGYEPILTSGDAKAPLYALPGIDLVGEAVPANIEDVVHWHFTLVPVEEARLTKPEAEAALTERARLQRGQLNRPAPKSTTNEAPNEAKTDSSTPAAQPAATPTTPAGQ